VTSDNTLADAIRRTFATASPGYVCDDLALAEALAGNFGDRQSVADIRALVVLEAAAAGVPIAERIPDATLKADD
jgi:hypothetical protein